MKSKNYILILVLLAVFSSCKKELTAPGSVIASTSNKSTITPYSFDWELGDYMPAPAGTNILVPWASSANRSFPLIYVTDIKKSDGWELVYNTFSPEEFKQPAYFVLYNRYRGLFRGYFYLSPGSAIPSSNISHSLIQDVAGDSNPLLSYSATEVSNLSLKTPVTTTVQQYKTSATGSWYAAEFEMAYDPSIIQKAASNTRMTWAVNSVNTTNISLNGTSKGTIKGTISQPSPSSDLLGSTIPGLLTFPVEGLIDVWNLPDITTKALKAGLTSGLGGVAKNVLNGIFGGSSDTEQYANLTTSADIQMSGTATDIYQLQNPSLVMPGTLGQDNVTGYAPLYKEPLGIMSLSSYPKLYYRPVLVGGDGDEPAYVDHWILGIDRNSYVMQFNPSIINNSPNGATINNLKQEIVFFENYKSDLQTFQDGRPTIDEPIPLTDPTTEIIDGKRVIVNDLLTFNHEAMTFATGNGGSTLVNADLYNIPFRYERDTFSSGGLYGPANKQLNSSTGIAYSSAVLRISFDVVPNNGAPKSKIVKSFNLILSN
ncbi:MAG: hypothetical protein J7577_20530 [Sphingobacteriaceae bacterium]|nr:hypothetical protein [Sphingobacteriaceae bacterium]